VTWRANLRRKPELQPAPSTAAEQGIQSTCIVISLSSPEQRPHNILGVDSAAGGGAQWYRLPPKGCTSQTYGPQRILIRRVPIHEKNRQHRIFRRRTLVHADCCPSCLSLRVVQCERKFTDARLAWSESECMRFRPYEHRLVEQPPPPFRGNAFVYRIVRFSMFPSLLLQARREVSGLLKSCQHVPWQ